MRGLKSINGTIFLLPIFVALPVSAWIEINFRKYFQGHRLVALPVSAWIEILCSCLLVLRPYVALPVSAWIEIRQLEASIPLK